MAIERCWLFGENTVSVQNDTVFLCIHYSNGLFSIFENEIVYKQMGINDE